MTPLGFPLEDAVDNRIVRNKGFQPFIRFFWSCVSHLASPGLPAFLWHCHPIGRNKIFRHQGIGIIGALSKFGTLL